jgi:hypothetical protein
MSVRQECFVFDPGPRNDWRAVLYRPGRDRTHGSPEMETALCDVVIGLNG